MQRESQTKKAKVRVYFNHVCFQSFLIVSSLTCEFCVSNFVYGLSAASSPEDTTNIQTTKLPRVCRQLAYAEDER